MDLPSVVSALESYAPTSLAQSWDNVGLLIEPSGEKTVKTILLTNDLTEDVMAEAIDSKADLIISYHPPIFRPLKRLTSSSWKERVAISCLEHRIALYAPHTAWDAVAGGVTDWLVEPYGEGEVQPLTHTTAKAFPGGITHTLSISNVPVATDQLQSLLSLPDVSVSLDQSSLSIGCTLPHLPSVMSSLPASLADNARLTAHLAPPLPNTGDGRVVTLDTPITLAEALHRTKKHLKMDHLRLAVARGRNMDSLVARVAVCAGAGASVLAGARADLLVTGEMSHHEVLDFVHKGKSVILADHSNTERGFLERVKERIKALCEDQVEVLVSKEDRDPLKIV